MSNLPRALVIAPALATLWLTSGLAIAQKERQEQESTPTTLLEIQSGKLTVEAHWAQIADSTYKLHKKATAFRFRPAAKRREYSADAFRGFLPEKPVKPASRRTLGAEPEQAGGTGKNSFTTFTGAGRDQ